MFVAWRKAKPKKVAAAETPPPAQTREQALEEDAALADAAKSRQGGDPHGALSRLFDCVHKNPMACRCTDTAGELVVDLGEGGRLSGPHNGWLEVMHSRCPNTPRHLGQRAEMLIAHGIHPEALDQAGKALEMDANEPHANFALAWALDPTKDLPRAIAAAEKAVEGGRGVPAMLLLATLRTSAGDVRGAKALIEQAHRLAPGDARVAYDLGVAEQSEGHYREAREAYLEALRADPKLADARYNLALLTHSVKADDEARHDLDELAAIAPGDPRIAPLRAQLSADAGAANIVKKP
jgi:tetratricopeptide (TPR) repeat protein